MTTKDLSENRFQIFFGVVEDRDDPMKLGRVRVRIVKMHTQDKSLIPTDTLPWAIPIMPFTSASSGQVGVSPTGISVGAFVFGFFADGEECQMPMVLGTIAGIPDGDENKHDVSPYARGINNLDKQSTGPEPASPYQAKYPYNKVTQTESGHIIEIDDTPGQERIHVFHKSGTYIEVDRTGRQVNKIVGDSYHIVAGKQEVYIEGEANVTVRGNITIKCDGSADVKIAGSTNVSIDGSASIDVGGTTSITSSGNATIKAPTTTVDGDVVITGSLAVQGAGGATSGTIHATEITATTVTADLVGTADVAKVAHSLG